MAPTLNSISPSSGPPGTAITLTGAGFDVGSQAGCPALVATTFVDANTLTAEIPAELAGAAGTETAIAVFVQNSDGSTSTVRMFTVQFPASRLQAWTTVAAVAGEVPGFARGGAIADSKINDWIRSVAQQINGAMLKRGLPLDPGQWQQADAAASPNPVDVLEMINRFGAGASLAAAVASQFSSGEFGIAKKLQADFLRELKALQNGDYDKLFRPGAATVEAGPQLSAGDMTDDAGDSSAAFTKGQIF